MAHLRQLIFTLTSLLLLPACTIVNIGGSVDNIGREVPVSTDYASSLATKEKDSHLRPNHESVIVYTTADGKRYAQLDVRYLPARSDWFRCFQVGGCPVMDKPRFHNRPLTTDETAAVNALNSKRYYVELEGTSSCRATRLVDFSDIAPYGILYTKGLNLGHMQMSVREQQAAVNAFLPDRRSGLNTAVQPLRWAGEVADIPLSIVATPVNWIIMLTGHNLWKY